MKKQILVPMILTFFFLIGETFAGNGMMNTVLVNANPMSNLEMHHQQPDSSSMKTHHQMKSGNMMMQDSKNMKCDSAQHVMMMNRMNNPMMKEKMMKMMQQMGSMNMKGMDSAARSKMMKKHMTMMMEIMSGNKNMKCDSTKRKKMMGQMGNMDMKAGNTTHDKMASDKSIVRTGVINLEAIDKNKDGKLYEDVMDFNVISDKPGVCPLCGMKLREMTIKQVKHNLKKHGFKYK